MVSSGREISWGASIPILFLSAISAHALAGGSFVTPMRLAVQAVAISITLIFTAHFKLEGPTLALLVLLIQSTSHFILGGGSLDGEMKMTISHLISGISSYCAISYFDILWEIILSIISSVIPTLIFSSLIIGEKLLAENRSVLAHFQIQELTQSLKFRGPPKGRLI